MKTYEKYLLTEAVSAKKLLQKIEHQLKTAVTPADIQDGMALSVKFIKKFGELYTDEISKKIDTLARSAKKRLA